MTPMMREPSAREKVPTTASGRHECDSEIGCPVQLAPVAGWFAAAPWRGNVVVESDRVGSCGAYLPLKAAVRPTGKRWREDLPWRLLNLRSGRSPLPEPATLATGRGDCRGKLTPRGSATAEADRRMRREPILTQQATCVAGRKLSNAGCSQRAAYRGAMFPCYSLVFPGNSLPIRADGGTIFVFVYAEELWAQRTAS